MGCWNGTCMISNLPILSGEEIKLVILQEGYDKSILGEAAYVYSSGLLSPAFFPLSGIYNDYGGIENIEHDWNYQIIEECLREKFGPTLLLDKDINKDWTLEDLLAGIERGNPKYKNRQSSYMKGEEFLDIKLSTVMIRQEVWDLCVNIQKKHENYWNDRKISDSDSYYVTGEQWAKEEFTKFLSIYQKEYSSEADKVKNELINGWRNPIFDPVGELPWMIGASKYKEFTKTNINNKELIESLELYWSEQKMVEGCLSCLRKGWMIQPGAGSQHSAWTQHIEFNNGIVNICEKNLIEE